MILPLLFNKILKEQVKKVAIALQSSGKNTDLSFSAFYTVSIILFFCDKGRYINVEHSTSPLLQPGPERNRKLQESP